MKNYDVIIVGAGPVGLATAIGLKARGVDNFIVLDQTTEFRRVGQIIDLLPNGLKALKFLDNYAYELVKKAGFNFSSKSRNIQEKTTPKWVHINFKGEELQALPLGYEAWFSEYGEGKVSIPWYDLQTTLRQQLPVEQVKANHRCINVVNETETGTIRLDFSSNVAKAANPYAHWSTQQKNLEESPQIQSQPEQFTSFRGRLVVAADGINSTLRRLLYQNTPYAVLGEPEYSGFAGLYCLNMGDIPNDLKAEIEEKFFLKNRVVTLTNDQINVIESSRLVLVQRQNGLGYFIQFSIPKEELERKTSDQLVDVAIQALQKDHFPDSLIQLVSLSLGYKMQLRLYYIHRATLSDTLKLPKTTHLKNCVGDQPPWSIGRAVLVGDAAHGMPPFKGQGANQGLEDALIISTLIANLINNNQLLSEAAITEIFNTYQSVRRPLIEKIQHATLHRMFYLQEQQWNEYNKLVYRRDFNDILKLNF